MLLTKRPQNSSQCPNPNQCRYILDLSNSTKMVMKLGSSASHPCRTFKSNQCTLTHTQTHIHFITSNDFPSIRGRNGRCCLTSTSAHLAKGNECLPAVPWTPSSIRATKIQPNHRTCSSLQRHLKQRKHDEWLSPCVSTGNDVPR